MLNPNLDRRITIQRRATTTNAHGESVAAWSTLAASLPAEVVPLSGREIYAATQDQARAPARFRIRYRSDVTRAMRIVYDGATYDISDVAEDRRFDRRQYLLITAEAPVA